MKKFINNRLIVIVILSVLTIGEVVAQYKSKVPGGDYVSESSWANNDVPSKTWETITIVEDSEITKNGGFTWGPKVMVNGAFEVNGNYTANNGGGGFDVGSDGTLIVNNGTCTLKGFSHIRDGGRVEIYGDFNLKSNINIEKGGVLIVHGSFNASKNWGMSISGNIIVKEDFSVKNGNIDNSGKVVVGGTFYKKNGGFTAPDGDTNLYLLDPDAPHYFKNRGQDRVDDKSGDLEDFFTNESGNEDLLDLVGNVLPEYVTRDKVWEGNANSSWSNAQNWKSGKVPEDGASVKIEVSDFAPEINEDLTLSKLKIVEGAKLVIKPGASLEITTDVLNDGQFILDSEADKLASLMLPESATKVGEANVKMALPADRYWYLSHPIQNAKSSIYSDFSDMENERMWVYRHIAGYNPGWFKVNREVDFLNLEGAHVIYEGADKELDYTGTLNSGVQERTFDDAGWHLVGNPYPTAIDWQKEDGNGWERKGISGTIYNRVDMGYGIDLIYTFLRNEGMPAVSQFKPEDLGYTDENIGYIAPYQSVWIKVEEPGSKLMISEAARVKDNSMPLKSSSSKNDEEENYLRIKTENQYLFDATVLYFNEAFDPYEGVEDVSKRFNSSDKVPEVYTNIGNKAMAINGLPMLAGSNYSISLSVRNRIEEEVKISVDLENFSENYDVVLEDKVTGTYTNMRNVAEYAYSPRKMGDDHDRFVLHFSKVQLVATGIEEEAKSDAGINIVGQKDNVLVQISPELLQSGVANVGVLDMNGRLVNAVKAVSTETRLDLPAIKGLYIVRVVAGNTIKTEKIIR